MNEIDWKECAKELPPCDGKYHVTTSKEYSDHTFAYYDGFGFRLSLETQIYLQDAYFWSHIPEEKKEKRYGKIETEEKKERLCIYVCYEIKEGSWICSWEKIFVTDSEKEASNWVFQKPEFRKWVEFKKEK